MHRAAVRPVGPWEEDVVGAGVDGVVGGAVDGGDPSVETGVDPRQPAAARAWVREAAAGWPEDVVEEVLLLLTEVLAADVERADVDRVTVAPEPRRLRLLAGGRGVELLLPGPLPDSARPRLAAARAVAAHAAVHTAGGWVRIAARRGRAPA